MRTVMHNALDRKGSTSFQVPAGSTVVSVGVSPATLMIIVCVEIDGDSVVLDNQIEIQSFGQGEQVPDGAKFIGTVFEPPYILHVYHMNPAN